MSSLPWKRRLGSLLGAGAANTPRTVVLLYHSVGDSPWAIPADTFREQVAWLSKRATIVPFDELFIPGAGVRVALTFDDGYASLHDAAAPILAEHGAVATVFLNTGRIGEGQRNRSDPAQGHYPGEFFMTWGDAAALADAGWTIGSHAVEHVDLTLLDSPRIDRELGESKLRIESRLGRPCDHFAYPWGRFTSELQRAVRSAGYLTASSGIHGCVPAAADRMAIPRIDVRAEYGIGDLESAVSGRWDYLGWKHKLQRAFA